MRAGSSFGSQNDQSPPSRAWCARAFREGRNCARQDYRTSGRAACCRPPSALPGWVAVGVEKLDFAPSEIADARFDLGAVAYDHPNQPTGMHHFFGSFLHFAQGEPTDSAMLPPLFRFGSIENTFPRPSTRNREARK